MARKKDTTALFEVISKARETQHQAGFTVPTWMGTDKQPEDKEDKVKSEPPPKSKPAVSRPVMSTGEPMVSIDGGRLRISLSQKASLAATIGMVVLLVAVFVLGRATAGGKVETGGMDNVAGTNNHGTPAKYQPVAGKYYLLIQKMNSNSTLDKNEAAYVVNYLKEKSHLDAWVANIKDSNGDIPAIFAAEEFDSDRITPAVENTALLFEEACAEYKRNNRTKYPFTQPRVNGKIKPKLLPY